MVGEERNVLSLPYRHGGQPVLLAVCERQRAPGRELLLPRLAVGLQPAGSDQHRHRHPRPATPAPARLAPAPPPQPRPCSREEGREAVLPGPHETHRRRHRNRRYRNRRRRFPPRPASGPGSDPAPASSARAGPRPPSGTTPHLRPRPSYSPTPPGRRPPRFWCLVSVPVSPPGAFPTARSCRQARARRALAVGGGPGRGRGGIEGPKNQRQAWGEKRLIPGCRVGEGTGGTGRLSSAGWRPRDPPGRFGWSGGPAAGGLCPDAGREGGSRPVPCRPCCAR